MPEHNFIRGKQNVIEAFRRNKRLGVKRPTTPTIELKKDEYSEFLEWYVFDKLNMTPKELLMSLETQYSAEQDFRDRRQRNIDFIRGRHFNETVYDAEIKRYTTQWEYLKRRNIPPLTYNVTSKLVRSLVGQFREINTGNVVVCDSKDDRGNEISHALTKCLEKAKKKSDARSKDAMNFKEMTASGSPVFKVKWGSKNNIGEPDVMFRNVNRANFILNPGVLDYDMDNLYRLAEIHYTTLNDIILSFAANDYEKGMQIRDEYIKHQGDKLKTSSYSNQSFDGNAIRNRTFHSQGIGETGYVYYEIWNLVSDFEAKTYDPFDGYGITTAHKWKDINKVKSEVDEINKERKGYLEESVPEEEYMVTYDVEFVSRWYVTYMAPWGMVLDVRESPYKSGLPPYVFQAPDINGEVWGIVEEILNAQLSLDRQIVQADAIVANASKGVWMIPDTAVPDDMTNAEYLTEMKKVNGAIFYKVREGYEDVMPKQEYAASANVSGSVQQLIQLYSNLVDEISGNYGAAQGRDSSTKTATGYALESQNAGLNVRDIMENYLTTVKNRDDMILQFILEGYNKNDYKRITGIDIDPLEVKQFQFSVEQSKGTNSPAHRMELEKELLNLVYNQLLPFEVFLDISNNPVMVQAKQKLEELKKQQAEQQQAMPIPQGNDALPVPPGNEQAMVQGSPQANMLGERGVDQQMRKLPNV